MPLQRMQQTLWLFDTTGPGRRAGVILRPCPRHRLDTEAAGGPNGNREKAMIGRSKAVLALLAGAAATAQAQMLERELGDLELKLGSTPSRSMAQGLVQPERVGTFHGGFDLTHPDGWYLGNWSP